MGPKALLTKTSAGADRVASAAIVVGEKLPFTQASAGIEMVVNAAIVLGLKLDPAKLKTGKLSDVKFVQVDIVNVLRIPAKLA